MRALLRLLRPAPRRGRHALGAAVTDIPSLPKAVVAPVSALAPPAAPVVITLPPPPPPTPPLPVVEAPVVAAPAPVPTVVPAPAVAYEPVVLPVQASAPDDLPSGPPLGGLVEWGSALPLEPTGPRIALGFRDGTVTALEPGSTQALALEELAEQLTRRDVL